jgi:polysaccharide biosynthesis protein PelA
MWTGNTRPFEAAIRQTRQAGLFNINGGDSRFDDEYPSYAWLSPIGRSVGDERQIFAANSNENTYTELWSARYHGFRFLVHTVENTEHPLRVKPFNLYYHMYSGERTASLKALLENLTYARRQPIIPITTSRYCAIAEGFYHTRFEPIDSRSWRIHDRGGLQTIRFDRADRQTVDFNRSIGVVGQRHYQQSLYIYLDEAVLQPRVTLSDRPTTGTDHPPVPYLLQSRWRVWDLDRTGVGVRFKTAGFGRPEMQWVVPRSGDWEVRSVDRQETLLRKKVDETHMLTIDSGDLTEPVTELIIQPAGS